MFLQTHFYCYPKPGYELLICKNHHHAVLPHSIVGHISSPSHSGQLTPAERSDIQEEVNVHRVEAPPPGSMTPAQRSSFWGSHWNEITTQQFFSRIPGDAPSQGQQHFEVLVNQKKKPQSTHLERASSSASNLVDLSNILSEIIEEPVELANAIIEQLLADYEIVEQSYQKQSTLKAA